jgi:hypothetical protein
VLLLPAAAAAAASAETPLLVLYEGGDDDEGALKRVRTQLRLQRGRFAVKLADFREVSSLLPAGQDLFVLGAVDIRPCVLDGPMPAAIIDGLVGDVSSALAYLEFDRAGRLLADVDALMPCLRGAVDPRTVGKYHLLRGLTAFYSSGAEEAQDEFRAGLLVSPFLQWNPDHPPAAEAVFRAAVGDALRTNRGLLTLSPGLFEHGTLYIDGVRVDPRMRTRDLFEGTHLVQWQTGEDDWVTIEGSIAADDTGALAHRADLLAALTARRGDPLQLEWLDERLQDTAAGTHEEVLVAQAARIVLFHKFSPGSGVWTNADITEQELLRARGRRLRGAAIGVGLGSGAAWLLAGGMFVLGAILDNNGLFSVSNAAFNFSVSIFVIGSVGLIGGSFMYAGGDQMARGRDRREYRRYQARVWRDKTLDDPLQEETDDPSRRPSDRADASP